MADLTITVTANVAIAGRKVTITETCVVEDVIDIGSMASNPSSLNEQLEFGTNQFDQNCPSFACVINASTGIAALGGFRLDDGGNSDYTHFGLMPGQFIIMHEHTNGAGMAKQDANMQTTYFNAMQVDARKYTAMHGTPRFRLLTANTATT